MRFWGILARCQEQSRCSGMRSGVMDVSWQ